MKPDLALPLALDQDPVVIPAWQKFPAERRFVEIALGAAARGVQQTSGLRRQFPNVDNNQWIEYEIVGCRFDYLDVSQADSPERRKKCYILPIDGSVHYWDLDD